MSMTLVAAANKDFGLEDDHGVLIILDSTGDTKHTWDRRSAEEVASIRKLFDDMKAKGMRAFAVKRDGSKDKQIKEFDPDAEKIIFAPALVGG